MGVPRVPAASSGPSSTVPVSSVLVDLILSFGRAPNLASRQAGFLELIRWTQRSGRSPEPHGSLLSLLASSDLFLNKGLSILECNERGGSHQHDGNQTQKLFHCFL
jgi:hypothetical protein